MRNAHRCGAVVVESYVPYSASGRNALCVVQDAHRCSADVEVTQLTFVPKQAIHRRCRLLLQAPRTLHEDSQRACPAEKQDPKPTRDVLETNSKLAAKAGALAAVEPTEQTWCGGVCGCKLIVMLKGIAWGPDKLENNEL